MLVVDARCGTLRAELLRSTSRGEKKFRSKACEAETFERALAARILYVFRDPTQKFILSESR